MTNEFHQYTWDVAVAAECRRIVQLAVQEDLDRGHDWTTLALVPVETAGRADVVARRGGVIAGLPAAKLALAEMDARAKWLPHRADGGRVHKGTRIATIEGSARSLLAAERLILNLLGRLSGIATLTEQFVAAVAGTKARIFDTRKTTPGWRRMEKYAVRQGGGWNHRGGLHDAILIKDNHLALGAGGEPGARYSPDEAVRKAREFLATAFSGEPRAAMVVEVEVDTLPQLDLVLAAGPDIVLLDNMPPADLREAVRRRDASAPRVQLEASGGVDLTTVAAIAQTGVDRISAGALTHSAAWFDVGLDWI